MDSILSVAVLCCSCLDQITSLHFVAICASLKHVFCFWPFSVVQRPTSSICNHHGHQIYQPKNKRQIWQQRHNVKLTTTNLTATTILDHMVGNMIAPNRILKMKLSRCSAILFCNSRLLRLLSIYTPLPCSFMLNIVSFPPLAVSAYDVFSLLGMCQCAQFTWQPLQPTPTHRVPQELNIRTLFNVDCNLYGGNVIIKQSAYYGIYHWINTGWILFQLHALIRLRLFSET